MSCYRMEDRVGTQLGPTSVFVRKVSKARVAKNVFSIAVQVPAAMEPLVRILLQETSLVSVVMTGMDLFAR